MSLGTCMQLCNHHLSENIEYFYHPPKVDLSPFVANPFYNSWPQAISNLTFVTVTLPVVEFYMNAIIYL